MRSGRQPTKRSRVREVALRLLDENPDGYQFTELVELVAAELPTVSKNTIQQYLWQLGKDPRAKVYKPARGLFRSLKYAEEDEPAPFSVPADEKAFYEPFADWLEHELEDCTKAIALGGHTFGDKWGTPDVIGIKESTRSDIIKAPTEVVSAEIKADPSQLVVAFGQACAYRLFSHRVYLVVPEIATDTARLESMCLTVDIGLVTFSPRDPKRPQFRLRVRPRTHVPDLFY